MQSTVYANLSWVRREKRLAMSQAYKDGIAKKDNLRVEIYENAVILPYYHYHQRPCVAAGGVLDENERPIPLSRMNYFTPIGEKQRNYTYSNEIAVYCGGCGQTLHWGHFLVDVVSRLWYALSGNEEVGEYIIVGANGISSKLEGNFFEFLRLLGIEEKVRILSEPTKFKKVIIPEKSYDYDSFIGVKNKYHYYTDEYLKTFDYVIKRALNEEARDDDKDQRHKKVYFIRKDERDAGTELIHSLFMNNGFELLDPAEISLSELIQKLHMCESVAYVTGTLQHNLMFAPQGLKAIAIERRAYVSPVLVDIDLIKQVKADYIDAHYSIVPDVYNFFGLYGYTNELKQYVEDARLNLPDTCYVQKEYCKDSVKRYMEKYTMYNFVSLALVDEYMYADYQTSIDELEDKKIFEPRLHECREYFSNVEKVQRKVKEILIDFRICYSKWDDQNWVKAHAFFSKLICNVLEKANPVRFLIYPFGKNGMLLKQILKEQYGIEEVIAFDNHLSKINKSIKPLYDIKNYYTKDSCIVLTSAIRECWEEISSYVDLTDIEGPFSVV